MKATTPEHSNTLQSVRANEVLLLSQRLWDARLNSSAIAPLTKEYAELSAATAYEIAWDGMKKREDQGEKIIGYKMGLTSKAKREQMNLKEPIYGILTDHMEIEEDGTFEMKGSIHPKAEPEIAFRLNKTIAHVPTPKEIFDACDLIAPAIEILDSRFEGFKYFSLPDVIADNSSSSHFLVGDPKRRDLIPHWEELAAMQMDFYINGKLTHQAKAAEISGNPVMSLVHMAELFLSQGRTIPANVWILTGAATPAVALEPGMKVELKTDFFNPTILMVH